jgi:DNA-directed RNA polymerase specialized sigma24 family protein
LYRYAWALLGNKDDALETVQESLLRFYRIWREGAIREHDRALLFRLQHSD